MIIILSPSKTQTFTYFQSITTSQPRLIDQAEELSTILRNMPPEDLAGLMKTSKQLTGKTIDRINAFSTPHT